MYFNKNDKFFGATSKSSQSLLRLSTYAPLIFENMLGIFYFLIVIDYGIINRKLLLRKFKKKLDNNKQK
jgi:hypothetical protein